MNNETTKNFISLITEDWYLKIIPPFIVGITAKIANDIREGRKMSFWGWLAIVVLSLCATFLSNWICKDYNVSANNTVIINAFSTLFSEQIFKILFSNFYPLIAAWAKENLKFTLRAIDTAEKKVEKDTNFEQ